MKGYGFILMDQRMKTKIMTPHEEAWDHVKEHLFGSVCEVSRRVPWGFINDKPDIINLTVDRFLNSHGKFDTIILHILSGEGEPKGNVLQVIHSAMDRCIKLVILEHVPWSKDFKRLPQIGYMWDLMPRGYIYENWGRNLLLACTTFDMLQLPELSDGYLDEHLDERYVTKRDHGIDKKLRIYTHTSESKIDFKLPEGTIHWVIGGGLAYESMSAANDNILFDSILIQVLECAKRYEPGWKIDRLFDHEVKTHKWPKQWRVVESNGVKPDKILHKSLRDLDCEGETVYVSTVDFKHWRHLVHDNNIIDSLTNRDKPELL